jgi:hypothetical protein
VKESAYSKIQPNSNFGKPLLEFGVLFGIRGGRAQRRNVRNDKMHCARLIELSNSDKEVEILPSAATQVVKPIAKFG